MNSTCRIARGAAMVLIVFSVAGCGKTISDTQKQGDKSPQEVSVVTVAPERIALSTELPGRLEASRVAEVRARVAGIVLKREFHEGSDVKAGDVLFRIDPSPFQAAYASAQAAVAKAEAARLQADLKVERYKPLVEFNAISKQEYDDAIAAQKQAAAELASAKAARQTASLNLGYATVTAPISGRVGRAQVTEGALVGQGEATLLATVQQIDPIYLNLTQSSTDALRLQTAIANGQITGVGDGQAKITLVTEDGRVYPQSGKLLFSDLTVDASSGALTLRAVFPNPDHVLLPGMYVRARLEQAVNEQAITVPQQAVIRSNEGASVWVVGADGKVAARPIKTGSVQGDAWIVREGLAAGDRVIVEGLQKAKPGVTVKPVPWQDPANNALNHAQAASQVSRAGAISETSHSSQNPKLN